MIKKQNFCQIFFYSWNNENEWFRKIQDTTGKQWKTLKNVEIEPGSWNKYFI